MLLIIQYTVTDLRRLIDYNCGILPHPDWPFPNENDFIKSMGTIGYRKSGGLNNWVGESNICLAKRSIKINKWLSFSNSKLYNIKLIFRRFFFDGFASGKYEFGFQITDTNKKTSIKEIIDDLFSLNVRIPVPNNGEYTATLGHARNGLKEQYFYSSTLSNSISKSQKRQIKCSEPSIFIEKNKSEIIKDNLQGSTIKIDSINLKISSIHTQLTKNKKNLSIWLFENGNKNNINKSKYKKLRDTRVFLSRINSTRLSLREILTEIDIGNISPKPRTIESDFLQEFLLSSIKNIIRKENDFENDDLTLLIRDIENRVIPGLNNSLFQRLKKSICIRPQVLKKVKEFLEQEALFKNYNGNIEIIMGNKKVIKIGSVQGGIVNFSDGDIHQIITNSFNKTGDLDNQKLIDLIKKIEEELAELKGTNLDKDLTDIEDDLKPLKDEINRKSPRKGRLKDFFNNFFESVKTIGEAGLPIVKLIAETLAIL